MSQPHSAGEDELATRMTAIEGWAKYQIDENVEQVNAIIKAKSWNSANSMKILEAFGLRQLKMLSNRWDSTKLEAHIYQKVGSVIKVLQIRREKEAIAEHRAEQHAKQLSRERSIQQIKDLLTLLRPRDPAVISDSPSDSSGSDTPLIVETPATIEDPTTVEDCAFTAAPTGFLDSPLNSCISTASVVPEIPAAVALTTHVDNTEHTERLRPPFDSVDDILVNYWGDEFSALRYFRIRSEKLSDTPVYFKSLRRFRFDNWTPCKFSHTRLREATGTFDAVIDATENLRPPILSFERWDELQGPQYARYRECEGDVVRYRKHVASDKFVFGRTNYFDKYPLVKDDPVLIARNRKPRSPESAAMLSIILPAARRRSSQQHQRKLMGSK
jgi:hypothetical protein